MLLLHQNSFNIIYQAKLPALLAGLKNGLSTQTSDNWDMAYLQSGLIHGLLPPSAVLQGL